MEWKFARSRLYMEFIKDGSTLPVPFNIIPSPKSFLYIIKHIAKNCKTIKVPKTLLLRKQSTGSRNSGKMSLNDGHAFQMTTAVTLDEENCDDEKLLETALKLQPDRRSYDKVIKRVVKRFIFDNLNSASVNSEGNNVGGELDDVKRGVTSMQEEFMTLKAHQKVLQDSMCHVNTKLTELLKNRVILCRPRDDTAVETRPISRMNHGRRSHVDLLEEIPEKNILHTSEV